MVFLYNEVDKTHNDPSCEQDNDDLNHHRAIWIVVRGSCSSFQSEIDPVPLGHDGLPRPLPRPGPHQPVLVRGAWPKHYRVGKLGVSPP